MPGIFALLAVRATANISGIYNGKQFAPNSVYDFTSSGNSWSVGGGTILSGQGTNTIE